MRTARLAAFTLLVVSVLAGCGAGQDVGAQIYEMRSTELAVVPGPTASTDPTDSPSESPVPSLDEDVPPATQALPAAPSDTPLAAEVEVPTAVPLDTAAPLGQPPAGPMFTFDPELWDQGMASLSSFRQKVVLAFTAEETGTHNKITYEGQVTVEPCALRSLVRVEGQGAQHQLPSSRVEVIWIGEQVWVKLGRQPWVPIQASAVESQYAGEVVSVGRLLPFVDQASRILPDETVNGIPCQHYVYDVSNLQAQVGMASAHGDIWVAKDGGYVVRLTLDGQGTYYDTYGASGTLRLVYDLYDVDLPLEIKPPR